MARTKVDNKLNVVVGTKAQVEADNTIPDNSIVIVTDEELEASDITQDANNRFVTDTEKSTWNGKVTSNSAITGATKTKITYDAKGLVTAGEDLTADDIPAHQHTKSEITDFPTIPTVPTISTDIETDATSDIKTTSPKAVKTYVDNAISTAIGDLLRGES